ncbi:MAG: hydroxymethylglutaryl-CoA lyase [Burkholderiaceae bacterium]
MSLPDRVKIVDVSPRDGLQNEKQIIDTAVKIELVNRLANAGVQNVESVSFVSPKWVPQMADGALVMAGITRRAGTLYSALVPNMKGFDAALAAGVDEIVIFGAASEAFSQRNINCSIDESLARFEPVAEAAKAAGLRLRGSISCALGCPYQGDVPVSAVVNVARRYDAMGCDEIDVADTIGVGTPRKVSAVMAAVTEHINPDRLSGHFHDTYGQSLANILAAMQAGISIFHSSVAGLGGCPYAKGATGNVATEDVLFMLHGMGIDTGLNLDDMVDIGQWISGHIGKKAASRAGNALAAKKLAA